MIAPERAGRITPFSDPYVATEEPVTASRPLRMRWDLKVGLIVVSGLIGTLGVVVHRKLSAAPGTFNRAEPVNDTGWPDKPNEPEVLTADLSQSTAEWPAAVEDVAQRVSKKETRSYKKTVARSVSDDPPPQRDFLAADAPESNAWAREPEPQAKRSRTTMIRPASGERASEPNPFAREAVETADARWNTAEPAGEDPAMVPSTRNLLAQNDPFSGGGANQGRYPEMPEADAAFAEREVTEQPLPETNWRTAAAPRRTLTPTPVRPHEFPEVTAQPLESSNEEVVYVVESGDSFWSISKRVYGTGKYHAALTKFNHTTIPDPAKIKPGMEVVVPDTQVLEAKYPDLLGKPAAATSRGNGFHRVNHANGEAAETNVTPAAGSIESPWGHTRGTPAAPAKSPESHKSGFFVDPQHGPMFRAGPNDTLSSIAQATLGRSSRWKEIQTLNRDHLASPEALRPGFILKLPRDAGAVRRTAEAVGR